MLAELKNAFKDVFSKQIRGLIWLTAITTLLVFIVLFCLFVFGMSFLNWRTARSWKNGGSPWLYSVFYHVFDAFPRCGDICIGFFYRFAGRPDGEKNNISGLRDVPLSESVVLSGVAAFKGVALSAVLIPVTLMLGLIPFVNLVPVVLYYGLNGRLLAREYFFAVALRYMPKDKAEEMFGRYAGYWTKSGIIIAVLMTIPVMNVISPLIAMAFMQRLFLKKQQG